MKKRYEELELEIHWLNGKNVLTESEEPIFSGDGWVKDPFED